MDFEHFSFFETMKIDTSKYVHMTEPQKLTHLQYDINPIEYKEKPPTENTRFK